MKTFVAVSRCLACKQSSNKQHFVARFHFKGVLWNQVISEIMVYSHFNFKKGEDYILQLQLIANTEGILKSKLVRQRPLNEIKSTTL